MRNTFRLSTIALLAAIISTAPASAISLNLGGGNGGLLGLGGNSDNGGLVDANVGSTNISVGGNGGLVTTGPSSGSSAHDAAIDVEINSGSPTSGHSGNSNGGLLNLGGNGGLLDLGGNGGNDLADVNVGVGGSNGSHPSHNGNGINADVTLLGNANDDPTAAAHVNIGGGGGNSGLLGTGLTASVGTSLNLGGLLDDLFGGVTGGDGGSSGGGNVGSGPGGNGGVGDTGTGGNGGFPGIPVLPGGGGGGNNGQGPGIDNGANGFRIASLDDGLACFTPTRAQLAELLGRHSYSTAYVNGITGIKVIKVPLCPAARTRIANAAGANANYVRLQRTLGMGAIAATLRNVGYAPDDVIAVDRQGKQLIVYVI